MIALIAAAIAYRATQTAARTQSETALTVQKHQFQDTRAREERANRKRELATIIRLRMKFALIDVLLKHRLSWIEEVENRHVMSLDVEERDKIVQEQNILYLIPEDFLVWKYFKEARSIVKEAEIYDAKDQDLENLEPAHQVIYHSLYRGVSNYDKLQADAVALAEVSTPKYVYLGYAKTAAEQALSFIQENDPPLAQRVEELSKQST